MVQRNISGPTARKWSKQTGRVTTCETPFHHAGRAVGAERERGRRNRPRSTRSAPDDRPADPAAPDSPPRASAADLRLALAGQDTPATPPGRCGRLSIGADPADAGRTRGGAVIPAGRPAGDPRRRGRAGADDGPGAVEAFGGPTVTARSVGGAEKMAGA